MNNLEPFAFQINSLIFQYPYEFFQSFFTFLKKNSTFKKKERDYEFPLCSCNKISQHTREFSGSPNE